MSLYLHRDRRTGLQILAGDYLDEILPDEIAFQISLRKNAEERGGSDDASFVDLEIFFADVNCGLLASDRKPSRCVLLTARHLAVYTLAGVLKHKIALEDVKRIEFLTTQDDSAASVLVVLRDDPIPVVFSFLGSSNNKNKDGTLIGQDSSRSFSTASSNQNSENNNNNNNESASSISPTARVSELRMCIGALARLRAEESSMDRARERTATLQREQQHAAEGDANKLSEEDLAEKQQEFIKSPTQVNTIVVVSTENAVKLDLLLRSLASSSIDRALKSEEPAVQPLEIPRVLERGASNTSSTGSGSNELLLIETIERLGKKEKDLVLEDAKENQLLNAERLRNNNGFRTSAQHQGILALVDGMNLWVSARQNLVKCKQSHQNTQSNLENMLRDLKTQHELRNEQVLRLADEAQKVADEHNETIAKTRQNVEAIDARIKQMELELQAVTDNFTEAMKHKDSELLEAKRGVDRMRYELTKGSYSELPSLAQLESECEKLEAAVHQQSAKAEELHISAPDKSILKHLTVQLEDENGELQEEILGWKNQRRGIAQRLISHKMDLANAEARSLAARKKNAELSVRKSKSEADHTRLKELNAKLEKRVQTLQLKLRRIELEAVVVEDLKREEMMHRSMVQSVRQDIKSDLLEKRRVERMMKQEQERRSKSRQDAYNSVMGLE